MKQIQMPSLQVSAYCNRLVFYVGSVVSQSCPRLCTFHCEQLLQRLFCAGTRAWPLTEPPGYCMRNWPGQGLSQVSGRPSAGLRD